MDSAGRGEDIRLDWCPACQVSEPFGAHVCPPGVQPTRQTSLLPWLDYDVPPGWAGIVRDLHDDLATAAITYGVVQVKEKLGELRVYLRAESDPRAAGELVLEAERRSRVTCQECGAPGQLATDRGWLRTACPAHVVRS